MERYQDNANMPQATLDFIYDGPKRVRYAYDSNGNITCDPLRCFEIRYNLLNLASEVIGHDPEESADSATASAGDGTTRYIGSLIYEGEPGQETLEGVSTDANCIFMQVDPMAEKYYGMTPYAYCSNNTINRIDPFGQAE
ncbi:MAG: hypothetical protein SOV31_08625 [Candidatus Cryptobacteroides sp.]|nr:hypothetical protein [Candidatus Cryptobacteroides sp.]